ncbi:MAG TPA: ABC transporter ATP-binding protein [Candidatus Saccharimonadales bacterium]|jgi:ATP-binding cassette subfamily B protein|nr:ABC transporter ATP-binding protein [Candidatus Saccharimonadales bacterium]
MNDVPPALPPQKSANAKTIGLYLRYWRQYPLYTIGSIMFSLVIAIQAIIVPLMVALVLNKLLHNHILDWNFIWLTAILQLALIGLGYISDDKGVSELHLNVEKDLYRDCFDYLAYQDYSFFANRFSGSIVTQASRFAKAYTTFTDTIFFNLLPQLFSVLIAIGIMIHYSPLLGMTVLILWFISIGVIVKFALQRLPLRRAAVSKESEQIGELADVVTNSLTVKTFAAEEREKKRYAMINDMRGGLYFKSWHKAVRNVWIIRAYCALLLMIIFVGGILKVKDGSLGIATFLLFQVYIFQIIDSIGRSSFIVRQLEAVAGDGQEMTELLEQPPNIQDKPTAEKSHVKNGAIEFSHMTFQYSDNNSEETLFNNFNLQIAPGEKVGLVGPSGGGKTTITRLLLRFMDIQSGAIKIDEQDIRDIKQQGLRRAIAYVPQEPLLFHRSIKENISYGKLAASDEEIIEVAKKSFAHNFIKDLPQGYDTLVGERGVKLSGGQRQRVAVARAMLANAPILVLDEATSALDSESERYIQKALWELMKTKTAVVIAHRLSTIQRMDRIVVLDEGRIVEEGSHADLLKQNGLYARLWAHQSGGFIEED